MANEALGKVFLLTMRLLCFTRFVCMCAHCELEVICIRARCHELTCSLLRYFSQLHFPCISSIITSKTVSCGSLKRSAYPVFGLWPSILFLTGIFDCAVYWRPLICSELMKSVSDPYSCNAVMLACDYVEPRCCMSDVIE